MPQTPNLADQWGKLNAQQRQLALSRMDDTQKKQLAVALGFGNETMRSTATVSAAPAKWSLPWAEGKAMTARDWLINQLPAAGGIVGGLIGAGAGSESGPGAVLTATAGAAAGGGLGEDIRQSLQSISTPKTRK